MDFFYPKATMAKDDAEFQTAASLRRAGRMTPVPFDLELTNGQVVKVIQLLRVLPGKRITGKGLLGSDPVLIKLFIARDGIRHWRRELAGIKALETAGIPTPRLLSSRALKSGGYALLTAFLDPSETLAEKLAAADESPLDSAKVSLLIPALHLLGRLHAAGLIHNDIHLGNFLCHAEQLYIIDGDAIRTISPGEPIRGKKVLNNLAILLNQLPETQMTLLDAYRQTNPEALIDSCRMQKAVRKRRYASIERALAKSVRDCSRFSVQRSFKRFTAVVRDQKDRLDWLIQNPDRAVETSQRLKDGGRSTVACVKTASDPVVIKQYNLGNQLYAFSRLWRQSRAWHCWKMGLRLQSIGLQTPQPLALIEDRFGWLRRRAWLITAFCPGIPLKKHLRPDSEPSPQETAAIVTLFNALYDEQISHGDLKATNLLWHKGRLLLIDLDAAKKHRFSATHRYAWKKDRARLLLNWPSDSVLHRWLDANLPR